MKTYRAFFCALFFFQSALAQLNVSFRSQLAFPPGIDAANIWGYVDSLGNEYALVGTEDGVRIVDVTNPVVPVQRFAIAGNTSLWREIKTWGKYAYVTTEATSPNLGIQIINLSALPGSVTSRFWRGTGAILNTLNKAHALHVDAGYLYLYGTNLYGGAPLIVNLADPWNPAYVGVASDPVSAYVHDGYVRNDLLYSGHIYGGFFDIWNVTNKAAPVLINRQNTPNNFTHNTWLTDDSRTLLTTDEVSNAYLTAFDISDPYNITELDRIQSQFPASGSIVHNTHVINDYAVTSWYRDGITIVDASRPSNLVTVGYYDCNTALSGGGFNSVWGVYPFLPSGNLVVSDMEQGLIVLSPTYVRACYLEGMVTDSITGIPIASVLVEILTTTATDLSKVTGRYGTGTAVPGTYNIRFSKAGYVTKTITNVSLSNGVVTFLDAELVPLVSFTVTGNVKSSFSGANIASANVKFESGIYTYNTTSNPSGNFTITGVYADTYNITAGKWLYRNACTTMNVTSSSSPIYFLCDTGIYDDFTFNFGWTVSTTASTGGWVRAVPVGTTYSVPGDANPGADASADCSKLCYITGNGGGTYGYDDVDNGATTINSPFFNLTSFTNPQLSYSRWFFNIASSNPANDTLRVSITNGITTVVLENVIASTPPGMSQWVNRTWSLNSFIAPTASMRLIVYTSDVASSPNTLEAGFDFFSVSNISPLPVELTSFSAEAEDGFNLLSWTTASETNNRGFEIEKSGNGELFSTIGFIDGAGNSTAELYYFFKDYEVNAGTVYYRLKQLDYDGNFSYSEKAAIKRDAPSKQHVFIHPNPAGDFLQILFTLETTHASDVKVFDAFGKKVFETEVAEGIRSGKIQLSNLSLCPGFYTLHLRSGAESFVEKFLKD